MSDSEQDAAIGRLVRQRSEAKRRKILLENELRSAGKSLSDIGEVLKHFSGGPYDNVDRVLPLIDIAPDICGLERVRSMLKELAQLKEDLALLDRSVAEFGIPA
jgi:hypothetical protein